MEVHFFVFLQIQFKNLKYNCLDTFKKKIIYILLKILINNAHLSCSAQSLPPTASPTRCKI